MIWFILASLIAPGLKRIGFGSLDRWLGVLFGFVRGYGLVLIVFVAAVFAVEGEDNLPDTVKESHSTPLLSRSAHYFSGFVPKDYRHQLLDSLSYSIDEPDRADKQTFSDEMKLLSDEKAK